MSLKVPQIRRFQDAPSFFQEFFEQNKQSQRGFSHRQFAKKIAWPASYLHDVIKRRKKFTAVRAIQFAKYTDMDSLATERLIYFALSEETALDVQSFSKAKLKKNVGDEKQSSSLEHEFFENVEYQAILAALVWARKRLSGKEMKPLLYTLPHLTEKKIEWIIHYLEKKTWITFDAKGGLKTYAQDIALDEHKDSPEASGARIHSEYAKSFLQFTKTPQIPGMYNSGFIEIPRKDFLDVAQRLLEVRNWLLEYSKANQAAAKESTADTLVFQFDINFFTALDKEKVDLNFPRK